MTYGANTTNYSYDTMSRLAAVAAQGAVSTYTRISGSNLLASLNITNNAVQVLNVSKTYDNTDRLLSIVNTFNAQTISRTYTYDLANRRTEAKNEDNSAWKYTYDNLGQVTNGHKVTATNQQLNNFGYTYDDIGNFKTENRNGNTLTYTSNNVNQYTQRTIPGAATVSGSADSSATVFIQRGDERPLKVDLVNGAFSREYKFDNSSAPVNQLFKIYATKPGSPDLVKKMEQTVSLPKSPELITYDNDGNMLYGASKTYYWDAENRLTKVEKTNSKKVEFKHDYSFRRTEKKVYNWVDGAWSLSAYIRFAYDGWNLVAELDGGTGAVLKSYVWGEDLSGSMQGVGEHEVTDWDKC